MPREFSNRREAENLVLRIERGLDAGELQGSEVFLITDNMVFEGCYYKGYSKSSKTVSDVTLRLHEAVHHGGLVLHVIHVAGTRMKDTGVDGLSRGNLLEGILKGEDPITFCL